MHAAAHLARIGFTIYPPIESARFAADPLPNEGKFIDPCHASAELPGVSGATGANSVSNI